MKKWLVVFLLIVIAKVAGDRFMQSRGNVDANMNRIAAEMNKQLPQTSGAVRIDKVEYSNHVMRYSGTLLAGQELNDEMKTTTRQKLRDYYCGNAALRRAGVGVEYAFTKVGMQHINDKVSAQNWSTTVKPENCG